MTPRPALAADLPSVLALNKASEHFLSPLTPKRLWDLHSQADACWVLAEAGPVTAFLLAFREGAAYDSINYRWFEQRYPRFLYIDRVVVADAARGHGLGATLYRAAFARASATSVPVVTCEIDIKPPNPASARFHARFGFSEVGQQLVAGGTKLVSLQAAPVTAHDAPLHATIVPE